MSNQYVLSSNNYKLLKSLNLQELGDDISFSDKDKIISTSDIRLLLLIINDEIVAAGLTEDEEECNDYGRQLYSLYDELYFQK